MLNNIGAGKMDEEIERGDALARVSNTSGLEHKYYLMGICNATPRGDLVCPRYTGQGHLVAQVFLEFQGQLKTPVYYGSHALSPTQSRASLYLACITLTWQAI